MKSIMYDSFTDSMDIYFFQNEPTCILCLVGQVIVEPAKVPAGGASGTERKIYAVL